jgi:medium-chain acyl-[acyl-carrier-protein] hydrolase
VKQSKTRWVTCIHNNDRALLRLLCLPYTGGSASIYRFFPHVLPADLLERVEIWAVEYPGHGKRAHESPSGTFSALADGLAEAVGPLLAHPAAWLGYSLGAMLAYEAALRVREARDTTPSALFVAACEAPQFAVASTGAPSSAAELAGTLQHMGGIGVEVQQIEQRWSWYKAVFGLRDTYRYAPCQPLECPITAFGGADDPGVSVEALQGWQMQTARRDSFAYHLLPGQRHLFLRHPPFLRQLARSLMQCVEQQALQCV